MSKPKIYLHKNANLIFRFDAGEDRDIDFEWWPLDIRELSSNPKEMGDELQLCKGGDGKSSSFDRFD